jgi:hypothetical protein
MLFELNQTVTQGKKSVVAAQPDPLALMKQSTPLADDNTACFYFLAAKHFHSQPFAGAGLLLSGFAAGFGLGHNHSTITKLFTTVNR